MDEKKPTTTETNKQKTNNDKEIKELKLKNNHGIKKTEQMSHIFQYTLQFLLYSDLAFATGICLLFHGKNSLIHLRVVLSSDENQSIDLHANHLTGFYMIETLTLIYHFTTVFHLSTPWKRQKSSGILKFSGDMEMAHWPEMGHMG